LAVLRSGRYEEAEAASRLIADTVTQLPIIRNYALAVLATAELALERPADALAHAREGLEGRQRVGGSPTFESLLRLAEIESLKALGEVEAAQSALEKARRRILDQAESFGDESMGRTFLEGHPANVSIMSLEIG
jgi:hypothetical protein